MDKRDGGNGPFRGEESTSLWGEVPREFSELLPTSLAGRLLNGKVIPWSGPWERVLSPLLFQERGEVEVGRYPLLGEREAAEALASSVAAFEGGRGEWPRTPPRERAERVEHFLRRMREKRETLARLLSWEIAKPYGDALKEVDRTFAYMDNTLEEFRRMQREARFPREGEGIVGRILPTPLGVALCMGPYNYPLYESLTLVLPALLMGNTVLFKLPRKGLLFYNHLLPAFGELFPPGAVNVLSGESSLLCEPLLASGQIDLLAFIGSSRVASRLQNLHPRPHRLRTLLGLEAKNVALLLPGADLRNAAKECLLGALAFNGQRCAALKILFVPKEGVGTFLSLLEERLAELASGMPWQEDVFLTPLADPGRLSYLAELLEDALSKGAKVINRGGGEIRGGIMTPALLSPVDGSMRLYREEQFGPLVPIVPYASVEQVWEYFAGSPFGQQASLFGEDEGELERAVSLLSCQVARINIGCKCQRGPDRFPFTGRRDSAQGVMSAQETLKAFSSPLVVALRSSSGVRGILDREL